MSSIFSKHSVLTPTLQSSENSVMIRINDRIFGGLLTQSMGGRQSYRTQINMLLNGDIQILSAGKGIGSHEFTVFEGPFTDCGEGTPECISSYYESLTRLEERTIRIIYTDPGNKLTFRGVIVAMTSTRTVDDQSGTIMMVTKVEALGTWA